eukprot:12920473-Prorocentrum_lima.AAC.1
MTSRPASRIPGGPPSGTILAHRLAAASAAPAEVAQSQAAPALTPPAPAKTRFATGVQGAANRVDIRQRNHEKRWDDD